MSFFDELKRRNVVRFAGLYLAGAWLVLQVAGTVLPMLDAPAWLPRTVVAVVAISFVPALIFAWAFELTPEGLRRERDIEHTDPVVPGKGKRLDRVIMVLLALALGCFVFDKVVLSPARERALAESARNEGRSEALVESFGDKSIAVLPFVDMSPGHDQDYFSDGIAEELLNLLTQVPQLRVISRASAFSFKGKDIDVPELARRLNVAHVLAGSVRKSGNKVRVSAQLIDARSDTQLWSQTWDRNLDDIFQVQDDIAATVVAQLKVKLRVDLPRAKPVNPEAYSLFLQARALSNQVTSTNYVQSESLYEQALAIEPDYAAAWTGRSVNYFRMVGASLLTPEKGYSLARAAVDKAIAIDPGYAPAQAQSGWLSMYQDNDLAAAAQRLDRAIALEPTNSFILGKAAALMYNLGRLDESIALGEFEVARDPLYVPGHTNLAIRYITAGRLDQAIASYRTALRLSPQATGSYAGVGLALLLQRKNEAALDAIRQEADESERLVALAMVHHAMGNRAESDRALGRFIAAYGRPYPASVAYVLAYRGEPDRAFEWLEKAVQYRDPGLTELVFLPYFDKIRGDPRWLPFLRRIGRAPEQLASITFDVAVPK